MAAEKSASKRTRIFYLVLAWIPGIALIWALTLMLRWGVILFLIPMLWATWDYLRRGGHYESVEPVSKMGDFVVGAWREDADRKRRS